jgi:hypothetical protein
MKDANRWTIEELRARYELEPELNDVFVEGYFDREVLMQASKSLAIRPRIYEIDSVEVPATLLTKYKLTSGNKQRVMALSEELCSLPSEAKVSCIVDRDLDHWFTGVANTQRLRWSIFCSMECHFLTPNIATDILLTTGRAKIRDFDAYLTSLRDVLRMLYALRLTERGHSLSLKWVVLRKYLTRSGDCIGFDSEKYLVALLSSNSKGSQRSNRLLKFAYPPA